MTRFFNRGGLPRKIAKEIDEIAEAGNALLAAGDLTGAYNRFMEGLQLLPEPLHQWKEATWLFAALGDVYFQAQNYSQALEAFTDAIHCREAVGNPFLHLRLGQCQFELNNLDRAADELTRAYMGAGTEIFREEDPKYFEFLKTRIKPPVGGQW